MPTYVAIERADFTIELVRVEVLATKRVGPYDMARVRFERSGKVRYLSSAELISPPDREAMH